jgi:hypothetical protein
MSRILVSNFLGLIGAAIGGVLGFYTFGWLLRQGFYGLVIPGAFLGLGCSLLARHTSTMRGIVCGVAALGLSLFTEWYHWSWKADPSFQYFLLHVKDLTVVTLLMIGVGTFIGFWLARDAGYVGSRFRPTPRPPTAEPLPEKLG